MAQRKSKKGFNWRGITENADGTFTTIDKRGKTRVLKALHEQGVAVRSKKNSDGTWTITPVGYVKVSRQRAQVSPIRETGYRPRMREKGFPTYPRSGGYPGRGGAPGRRMIMPLSRGPVYGPGPRASGPSPLTTIGKKAGELLRGHYQRKEQARKEEVEFQKTAHEIDEKMRKERIEQETKEQKAEAQRQMEKDRLRREAMGQKESDLKESLHRAEVKAEQRRVDDTVRRQQEQRQQRQDARQRGVSPGSAGVVIAPEIPRQKVDEATLQTAREQAITGGD